MVVDGSRLVRKLIGDVLTKELPGADVVPCAGLAEAQAALAAAPIDLATTSLVLPDGDGQQLAEAVRTAAGQRYVPVVVVSGNAQEHLEGRHFSDDITDYFDKSHGHHALAEFIRGYVQPAPMPGVRVLYVEDSRTVALATSRMLKAQQMEVVHVTSVEAALEFLHGQATNVLALAPRDVVLLQGNRVTEKRLRAAGCHVQTYRGDEITLKAEGGATCLTRPVLRDDTEPALEGNAEARRRSA